MTTLVSALVWVPSQGGGIGSLVAQVTLASTTDVDFTVPVVGKYSTQTVQADGVIVDNTPNGGAVNIEFGSLTVSVPPFIRDTVALGPGTAQNIGVQFNSGVTNLYFYKGKPPISLQVTNYAGAAALNTISFVSGPSAIPVAGSQVVIPHPLGDAPYDWDVFLTNTSPELGYTMGETVKLSQPSQQNAGLVASADTAAITVYVASGGIFLPDKSVAGNTAPITPGKWVLIVKAWLFNT